MSFPHEAIAAWPTPGTGDPDRALIRAMTTRRFAYCLAADEAADDFVAKDPVSGVPPLYLIQNSILFAYDDTDSITVGDGVTCLVTNDACRYKSDTIAPPWSVLDKDLVAQPVSPSDGDRYLIPTAATGTDWAGKDGKIGIYKGSRWHFAVYPIGRFLYVEDETAFYHRNTSGVWTAGVGSIAISANSIPITAIIGAKASFVIKVENQTTKAPPGSRVTGATPTAPLGGTAANLNDNSDATVTTTSAIGDLSAAALSSRFFARLDLGASKNIVAVDLRGLLLSVVGPAVGLQLYTSPDGATWTAYGTSFSATNVAANVLRSGAVTARYVAAAALAANYTTITLQVSGLDVYDTTTLGTPGDAYIIDPSPTGAWAGNAGKLAICLVTNSYTIITPAAGDTVYDKALQNNYRFNGTAWISSAGAWVGFDSVFTQASGGSSTGSGTYTISQTTAPTQSQQRWIDPVTLTYTAKRAGAKLRISYRAGTTNNGAGFYAGALFMDSVSNAIAWDKKTMDGSDVVEDFQFVITATDALPHTYKFAIMSSGGSATGLSHRLFQIEEAA